MPERRRLYRNRVYYGGLITFNGRTSTLACIVRNFSRDGAKIEFENSGLLPDEVDFTVERKALCCPARLVWHDVNAAGLKFSAIAEAGDVISLEWARKLRASERINQQLKSSLDQLQSEQ